MLIFWLLFDWFLIGWLEYITVWLIEKCIMWFYIFSSHRPEVEQQPRGLNELYIQTYNYGGTSEIETSATLTRPVNTIRPGPVRKIPGSTI